MTSATLMTHGSLQKKQEPLLTGHNHSFPIQPFFTCAPLSLHHNMTENVSNSYNYTHGHQKTDSRHCSGLGCLHHTDCTLAFRVNLCNEANNLNHFLPGRDNVLPVIKIQICLNKLVKCISTLFYILRKAQSEINITYSPYFV